MGPLYNAGNLIGTCSLENHVFLPSKCSYIFSKFFPICSLCKYFIQILKLLERSLNFIAFPSYCPFLSLCFIRFIEDLGSNFN